jgi:hypothetical protein
MIVYLTIAKFIFFSLPFSLHVYGGDVANHQLMMDILPTSTYGGNPTKNNHTIEIHKS